MRTFLLSALSLALSAAPAFAAPTGEPGTQPGTTPGTTMPGTTTPGTTTPTAALNDAQILTILMDVNDAEIAEGRLVASRATNADVKAYGQRMINDHTASSTNLKTLATQLKLARESSDMDKSMQADATKEQKNLASLKGAAFDKAYTDGAVRDHQQLLDRIDTQFIPQAKDPGVQSALSQLRPVVAEHLQQAMSIQQTLGTTPGTK
jgi:putative membrane protein